MDLQQIFDAVAGHLIKQNKRAVYVEDANKAPKFMYKTPDGLMDAVGCLLYPGAYHPDMEGYVFKGVDTWKQHDDNGGLAKLKEALQIMGVYVDDPEVMRLLTDLQQIHDNHEPEFWMARFQATARTWRLNTHTLDYFREYPQHSLRPRRGL